MSSIPFVADMDFAYATPEEVADGVTRVMARNPSPFTLYGTGTFVVGRDRLAIVDPGPALDEHVDAVLRTVDGRPVSHIFVTHTHRDHSPAADILKAETGAETCGFGPHPTGRPEDGGGAPVEDGADIIFAPGRRLSDGDLIESDDWTIEAVHTPGHMSNHMCYALAGRDILFTGDHVMAWATSVISPPDGSLSCYMASLAKLLDRDESRYLPSHGPEIRNPGRLVRAHIDHRKARDRQIVSRLETRGGATPADLVEDIYEGLDPDLHEAASLSVLAHLIELRRQGRAACAGPCEMSGVWKMGAAA